MKGWLRKMPTYKITVESDLPREDFERAIELNTLLYRLNKAIVLDRALTPKEIGAYEALEARYNKLYHDFTQHSIIHPNFVSEFKNLELTRFYDME